MYINNVLYCFYFSDTEAFEACFRLLHDDDDDDDDENVVSPEQHPSKHAVVIFCHYFREYSYLARWYAASECFRMRPSHSPFKQSAWDRPDVELHRDTDEANFVNPY